MRILLAALLLIAAPAAADVSPFHTPSGNIQCSHGEDIGVLSDVTCEIIVRSGPPAMPKPESCPGAWGHKFTIRESGRVQMDCGAPYDGEDYGDVAGYGQTADYGGGFRCTSEKTGFTCVNRDGHGFFLSRASQRVW